MPSHPAPLPPIKLEPLFLQLQGVMGASWDWQLITTPSVVEASPNADSSCSFFLPRPTNTLELILKLTRFLMTLFYMINSCIFFKVWNWKRNNSRMTFCTLASRLLDGLWLIFSEKSQEYNTLSTVVPCSL